MFVMLGAAIAVGLIVAMAVFSGSKQVRRTGLGSGLVTGVILGSFIGGSSTIGTAQLAYRYGMTALCFHLGSMLGFLVLAIVFSRPLRREGGLTIVGIIGREYGLPCGLAASVLSAGGNFIALFAQLFAATSVIAVLFPQTNLAVSFWASAALMAVYVVFGGTRGAGMVGLVKLALLSISMLACAALVLVLSGGFGGILQAAASLGQPEGFSYLGFFNRGVGFEVGSAASMVIGIVSTQIYAQAVCAAKTDRDSFLGLLLGCLIIPVLGTCGVLVGLYMRVHFPGIPPKVALTQFALSELPALPAGIVLGTLFVTVLGSGAGVCLGIATILNRDVVAPIGKMLRAGFDPHWERGLIVALLVLAVLLCLMMRSDMILNYSVISMGLRGAVGLVPLACALWLKGRIDRRWALAAIILSPAAVMALMALPEPPVRPLFGGVALCALLMAAGLLTRRR